MHMTLHDCTNADGMSEAGRFYSPREIGGSPGGGRSLQMFCIVNLPCLSKRIYPNVKLWGQVWRASNQRKFRILVSFFTHRHQIRVLGLGESNTDEVFSSR